MLGKHTRKVSMLTLGGLPIAGNGPDVAMACCMSERAQCDSNNVDRSFGLPVFA
jgi:hypothetical protein